MDGETVQAQATGTVAESCSGWQGNGELRSWLAEHMGCRRRAVRKFESSTRERSIARYGKHSDTYEGD
jgi:hypothetical protein